jgi:hypothetical protein
VKREAPTFGIGKRAELPKILVSFSLPVISDSMFAAGRELGKDSRKMLVLLMG